MAETGPYRPAEEIAARLPSVQPASSWRDIATAPRDGTLILAWDGVNQSIVEFDDGFRGGRWFCIAGGEVVWDSPGDRSCLVEVSTPTHWRPLPPAPEPPR